jgi:DNA-binding response OmpR family regulator
LKPEIAYVDDSSLNLDCIQTVLNLDFNVTTFITPNDFLKSLDEKAYATILLDIHMPLMDGFLLYEKIVEHKNYNGCPILFISSDDSDQARIKSFLLGAVDFINRDTHPEEMIARIKSKILFYQKHRSIIEFTNLRVNLTLLKTYLGEEELPLTFIEFKILCLVLRNYPDTVSKSQLIQQVWRTDHVLDATIYTHISNLNNKLTSWDYEIVGQRLKGVQLVKKETNA